MSDLFNGLEGLGFNNPKVDDLFIDKTVEDKAKTDAEKIEKIIIVKTIECPVCEKKFENFALRSSQLRLFKTDSDLRPYYEPIDPLYYDVVMCSSCGYTAMNSTFKRITDRQIDAVKEQITPKFKIKDYPAMYLTDHAIERYTFALFNAYVKNVKNSEKGFLCLKLAWLYRDKKDDANELKFLKNALMGFKDAYSKEGFPMFNMDELTVAYLLGEMSRRCGEFDEALRYISRVVLDKNVNSRLKNRAIDVKELIREDKKRLGLV